jgi:transposase
MVVVASGAEQVQDSTAEALEFECRRFGAGSQERMHLIAWLQQRGVSEVVMESTAQYWKPVWLDLEPHFGKLHLAQAQSNRAPKGRKNDFQDARRLARRLMAGELMLSFVPDGEQRTWRMLTRRKTYLLKCRVGLQNRLESTLEEMRIKLSSVVSDLLGVSGRRILKALAEGETDAVALAALGDRKLKCGREALADALRGAPTRCQIQMLQMDLAHLELLDQQIETTDKLAAEALRPHGETVLRLAQIPGFGAGSAQQLIAEVGVDAEAFASADAFCSWIGVCPGSNISAEKNQSSHCAKGNRYVRRLMAEAAQAAVKKKGSHFQAVFRRFLPKLGWNAAIWAVSHRLARVVWKVLHDGVSYIEKGAETTPSAKKRRAQKLAKALRDLGYRVTLTPIDPEATLATA